MLSATGVIAPVHGPAPAAALPAGGASTELAVRAATGLSPLGEAARAAGGIVADADRAAPRIGFDTDVPRGGTSAINPGGDYPTGDRRSFMAECLGAYKACPWLSAPIDVTAATVTAGGVLVEPDDSAEDTTVDLDTAPLQVRKLDALVRYTNPVDDMVQLLDQMSADLDIFGDTFVEVVWVLGEPVALYNLNAATMSIQADEHGNVSGYWQVTEIRGTPVWFEPEQIIHVSERNPNGGLYGLGLVEKAFWPATTWLFAAGLLKERMRKGDPPDLHVDAPLEQTDNEYKRWVQQYRARNIGSANIGNPITTRGGFTIAELRTQSRADLVAIKTHCRDEMISLSGTPPHQVGIIESGNLGGGTGTSQWRSYMLNRVAPRRARIMEKVNFALCKAFGVEGYRLALRQVDYADDETQEQIYINRARSGLWSLNEARKAINLPPVPGGDDHIMVERSWVMDWLHMKDFSDSWIVKNGGVNYPPHTDDGFPPPNPYAAPPAAVAPQSPLGNTPPAPSPADDTDPDADPDTARDTPGAGGRRARSPDDPAERADWATRVLARYARQLEEAPR